MSANREASEFDEVVAWLADALKSRAGEVE